MDGIFFLLENITRPIGYFSALLKNDSPPDLYNSYIFNPYFHNKIMYAYFYNKTLFLNNPHVFNFTEMYFNQMYFNEMYFNEMYFNKMYSIENFEKKYQIAKLNYISKSRSPCLKNEFAFFFLNSKNFFTSL